MGQKISAGKRETETPMQTPTDARDFGEYEWGQSAAKREAAGLAVLLDRQTTEKLRADILISAKEASELRVMIGATATERLVDFRLRVAREFDRLVATRLDAIRADAEQRHARMAIRNLAVREQNKAAHRQRQEREQASA